MPLHFVQMPPFFFALHQNKKKKHVINPIPALHDKDKNSLSMQNNEPDRNIRASNSNKKDLSDV